jgi:hypothetical protein
MGYTTHWNGSLKFSEPVPIDAFREDGDRDNDFVFDVDYLELELSGDGATVTGIDIDDVETFNASLDEYFDPILEACKAAGVTISGEVHWDGEDSDDAGTLYVHGLSFHSESYVRLTPTDLARLLGIPRDTVLAKLDGAA